MMVVNYCLCFPHWLLTSNCCFSYPPWFLFGQQCTSCCSHLLAAPNYQSRRLWVSGPWNVVQGGLPKVSYGLLIIHNVFWYMAFIHSMYTTQLLKKMLIEEEIHGFGICLYQYCNIGNFIFLSVIPRIFCRQQRWKLSRWFFLTGICHSGFAAIKQSIKDSCLE